MKLTGKCVCGGGRSLGVDQKVGQNYYTTDSFINAPEHSNYASYHTGCQMDTGKLDNKEGENFLHYKSLKQ